MVWIFIIFPFIHSWCVLIKPTRCQFKVFFFSYMQNLNLVQHGKAWISRFSPKKRKKRHSKVLFSTVEIEGCIC